MSDLSVHSRVVERLVQQLYEQPIIDNVDRGVYVQYLIELALRERDRVWECMPGWSMWDLEHKRSRARIEVKQSSRRQTWSVGSQNLKSAPRFNIAPTKWYWDNEIGNPLETELQRWADLYIFAYHPESDEDVADHRRPDQWEFYLVLEGKLPALQKSIGLTFARSVGSLTKFEALADEVTRAIAELPRLKADSPSL